MQHKPILALSLQASDTIAPHRAITAAGAQVATAGDEALGISQYGAAAGASFAVIVLGTAKVAAGAAITRGASVMADGQGRAAPLASGKQRLGIALSAAQAAGDIIEILIKG